MEKSKFINDLYFKALELEEKGNYVEAFDLFMKGASLGDDGAQNAVGLAYDSGSGVEKNKEKALYWFKKAWRSDRKSYKCLNIALTYAEIGRRRQALYWWKKAISLGDGSAALALAKFLMSSDQRRSLNRAIDLLQMAVKSEDPWRISFEEREEARELLHSLKSTDPS